MRRDRWRSSHRYLSKSQASLNSRNGQVTTKTTMATIAFAHRNHIAARQIMAQPKANAVPRHRAHSPRGSNTEIGSFGSSGLM